MSDFERCKNCHRFDWVSSHRCPRAWRVRLDGEDEDRSRKAYGEHPDIAAEEWCRLNFAELDYPSEVELELFDDEDEVWRKFEVSVETEPVFRASEVT